MNKNIAYRAYDTSKGRILAFYDLSKNNFSLLEDDAAKIVEDLTKRKAKEQIIQEQVSKFGDSVVPELSAFIDVWQKIIFGSDGISQRQEFKNPPFGKGESAEDKFCLASADEHLLTTLFRK